MAQGILLDKSCLLEVILKDDHYHVIYGFHTFKIFHKNDHVALRLMVLHLEGMGVKKSILSRTFNIHHTNISKWKKVEKERGIIGVANLVVGVQEKCDEIIKNYIVELAQKLKRRIRYKKIIIDEVKKIFGVNISREIIRKVLKEYKIKEKTKIEENAINIPEKEENIVVKNGGVLLALPLLEKHEINNLIIENSEKTKGYSFKDIVMTISMLMTGGLIKNEEQTKLNDDPSMGTIILKKTLPCLRTIRRSIPQIIEQIDIQALKKTIASLYFSFYVNSGIFYLDGHFMPYHGKERILYGYNPIRRIAMKGRTAYVVNTENGRPIYQILSDNFDNFIENIQKIGHFLHKIDKIKSITLIFDRGGFDEEFLCNYIKKTKFICWWLGKPLIPNEGDWQEVKRYLETNIFGEKETETLKVKEEKIEMGLEKEKKIFRRFFIKKGDKISPAVTNDLDSPIEEVVRMLTRRWGVQENTFKVLKKFGYDNIHSYWKEEYSEKNLLDEDILIEKEIKNPEYQKAVEKRIRLKKKKEKLSANLGNLVRKLKNPETSKRVANVKNQIETIENDIATINERLDYLPEMILRFDYIKDNNIIKLGKEKKEYFDLMKFIAHNVRRDIVEIIGPIYKNNRDIYQIVLKWLQSKCIVRNTDETMFVILTKPRKINEENAMRTFCDYLNSLNYRHFNSGKIIHFTIS